MMPTAFSKTDNVGYILAACCESRARRRPAYVEEHAVKISRHGQHSTCTGRIKLLVVDS